jgi:hypothetical protein
VKENQRLARTRDLVVEPRTVDLGEATGHRVSVHAAFEAGWPFRPVSSDEGEASLAPTGRGWA